jgi:hypothetical protein
MMVKPEGIDRRRLKDAPHFERDSGPAEQSRRTFTSPRNLRPRPTSSLIAPRLQLLPDPLSAQPTNDYTGQPASPLSMANPIRAVLDCVKKFNRLYPQFYFGKHVDQTLLVDVCSVDIAMDLFDKVTLGKEYQTRIDLLEGKARFRQIPVKPHGAVVGYL